MAQSKDFYSVLGVGSRATQDEIKKSYRKLAKKFHPDANANDPKTAERFKEISEANNVLSNPEKRKHYDEMRRLGAFDGGFGGYSGGRSRAGSAGGFGGAGARGGGQTINFQDFDIGGLGGLGDLFSSMFGGGEARQGSRPRGPERGQTVEANLDIPFRTAARGGKVPIELEVSEECSTCHGTGAAPGAQLKICPECNGRGVISFGQGGFAVNRTCPVCLGKGQVPTEKCPTCHGSGEVRVRRKVLINVPPGVDTGSKIRLKGQGGKGNANGPPGDLVITFNVLPDKFYRRDGLDVIATVPLNIAQATLGTKISVRTLDGKKVAIKIPPGTPSGKRFRVRGQGIQKGDKKGDLIVEVSIAVPEKLSEEQERMMKEFANAGGMKY
ncbi:MAG TPA: molecular chaperone DnaJ [Gemmatimonadaceae bacterium]|nr:molecular chaperone DnaJ [Gemmatimonadaceae bacterium]